MISFLYHKNKKGCFNWSGSTWGNIAIPTLSRCTKCGHDQSDHIVVNHIQFTMCTKIRQIKNVWTKQTFWKSFAIQTLGLKKNRVRDRALLSFRQGQDVFVSHTYGKCWGMLHCLVSHFWFTLYSWKEHCYHHDEITALSLVDTQLSTENLNACKNKSTCPYMW